VLSEIAIPITTGLRLEINSLVISLMIVAFLTEYY
jgi:hypothetical protein